MLRSIGSPFPLRLSIVVFSAALYWMALTHPALLFRLVSTDYRLVRVVGKTHVYTGIEMLHWSILGPFQGTFAGFANLLLWLSWLLLLIGQIKYLLASSR